MPGRRSHMPRGPGCGPCRAAAPGRPRRTHFPQWLGQSRAATPQASHEPAASPGRIACGCTLPSAGQPAQRLAASAKTKRILRPKPLTADWHELAPQKAQQKECRAARTTHHALCVRVRRPSLPGDDCSIYLFTTHHHTPLLKIPACVAACRPPIPPFGVFSFFLYIGCTLASFLLGGDPIHPSGRFRLSLRTRAATWSERH